MPEALPKLLQNPFELIEITKLDFDFPGPLLIRFDFNQSTQHIGELFLQTQHIAVGLGCLRRFRRLERLLREALGEIAGGVVGAQAAAREAGHRSLLEDGLRRVADGTTSLHELARVVDLGQAGKAAARGACA